MRFRHPATVVTALTLATVLAACGQNDQQETDESDHGEHSAEEVSGEFNDADVEYVSGMIVHHEQAVEMSDILLAKDDVDTDVVSLAEEIRDAQQPEIDQMVAWLQDWGHDPEDDHGGHSDHGNEHEGMMSDDDIADLEAAQGDEAARLFLEQMIVHHEGAVSMAEDHLADGENPEALELSEEIISVQQAEIEQMEDLLENI
ncbi:MULTISPECIES: DUF305 domain-containing protein [Micrococcales]|uniref:DUF305 domain-containing protein n=1 Tax=Nesterenkonia sphaerica TaxID=1804988 RepID=A0A5R9A0Z3_9MICC|nr:MULTISPECIES: DUF305 domain-containing protein [Micrococcales]MCI2267160.1 DUF305 domain-containing protein [Sediminivirga luteola]TLP71755.1 DUF305 domain-containing protein [Nesterenkonia sphaerica]